MKEKILDLVDKICSMENIDCRSLNKSNYARELMDIANIPANATISEIPLDWDRQVSILFFLPKKDFIYELFAGVGLDNNFYFEISEIGTIENHEKIIYFHFYEEDGKNNKILPMDYFTRRKS